MRSIKYIALALLFSASALYAAAQDVVVIDSDNYIRGTIKNTDYASVMILKDDATPVIYKANDIQEFMWNGEAYISKRILIKKKMESRFFKALELGTVNLYAIGEGNEVETKQTKDYALGRIRHGQRWIWWRRAWGRNLFRRWP